MQVRIVEPYNSVAVVTNIDHTAPIRDGHPDPAFWDDNSAGATMLFGYSRYSRCDTALWNDEVMGFRNGLARFNRVVTNPVQLLWAGRLPPFAIVEHTGRKTGRAYRTPVSAFVKGDIVTIRLPYGTERDWVRNLVAAGGGVIERRGRRARVTEPEVSKEGRIGVLHLKIAGPVKDEPTKN